MLLDEQPLPCIQRQLEPREKQGSYVGMIFHLL